MHLSLTSDNGVRSDADAPNSMELDEGGGFSIALSMLADRSGVSRMISIEGPGSGS